MTRKKLEEKQYPNDTNLLQFLFIVARNNRLLQGYLTVIQFIRDNPHISEKQVRDMLKTIR